MKIVMLPPMAEVIETELKNYSSREVDFIELTESEFNRLWWEAIKEDPKMSRSSPKNRYKWRGWEIRKEGT